MSGTAAPSLREDEDEDGDGKGDGEGAGPSPSGGPTTGPTLPPSSIIQLANAALCPSPRSIAVSLSFDTLFVYAGCFDKDVIQLVLRPPIPPPPTLPPPPMPPTSPRPPPTPAPPPPGEDFQQWLQDHITIIVVVLLSIIVFIAGLIAARYIGYKKIYAFCCCKVVGDDNDEALLHAQSGHRYENNGGTEPSDYRQAESEFRERQIQRKRERSHGPARERDRQSSSSRLQ